MKDCFSRTATAAPAGFVCHCLQVTEDAVAEAVSLFGLTTLKEIRTATGAGDGCTACHRRLRLVLRQPAGRRLSRPLPRPRPSETAGSSAGPPGRSVRVASPANRRAPRTPSGSSRSFARAVVLQPGCTGRWRRCSASRRSSPASGRSRTAP